MKISFGSGNTSIINLPDGNVAVSAYSSTTIGTEQNLTVTYGGKTAVKTIDVEVYNYIDSASITPPNKVEYSYNTDLDLTGASMQLIWKNSNVTNVAITDSMISGYNKTSEGKQTITVTYNVEYVLSDGNKISDTIIKTFKVDVVNNISKIDITAPTKTKYNHGDSLDLTGGIIKITYENGAEETRTMTTAMITETDGSTVNMSPTNYDNTNKVSKTLKIEYTEDGKTGTVNYPIEIINSLKSISLNGTPKTSYNVNESLETGLSITVNREDGNTETISVTPDMISGFDTTTEGSKTATISYTENGVTKTTNLNYTVADSVTGITLKTKPSKTEYKYQEPLDITGGKITVSKGSGTQDIEIAEGMVSGYDKTTLGKQTLTITYGGQTVTYEVTVKDYVTGITVTPSVVTGKYNDELSKLINDNNITYAVTYAKAGAKTPVVLAESMVTGYSKTSVAEQNLTITYTDNDIDSATNGQIFTVPLKITLNNATISISMKQQPSKTEYGYGDTIDLSGGKITVTKENGDIEEKALTDSGVTITETDGSAIDLSKVTFGDDNTATKDIKVIYDGKDTIFTIKVINKVTKINMHTTPKTNYNVKDVLDLTTDGTTPGEILVTRQTGVAEVVKLTDSRVNVTGFDSSVEHTNLPLTVTFTENGVNQKATYNVNVKDTVTAVRLKVIPNKTDYKYNEELDVTGGKIEITKGSGTTTINLESSMVSGYDKTTLGKQTLTITYGGQTTTYKVNVKDYVTDISVSPTSVTGKYNDELSKLINDNNITYTVTYAKAGAKTPVVLAESMVTGYNKTNIAEQNLTVTYTDNDSDSATNGKAFTATLKITLSDDIESMEISSTPKQNYKYGEPLDITGGTIEIVKSSGTKTIPITESMVKELDGSEFDSTKLGTRNLNVTYGGITKTYEVTVSDYVVGITLTPPTKTKYQYGESLKLTGGTVQKIMASNAVTTAVALTDSSVNVSAFNPNQTGTQVINVTYEGFTKNFGVIVEDSIQSIEIKTKPKVSYKYGEELDVTGGEINVIRSSGVTTVAITKSMVSGYNPETLGNQELTVTYEGKQAKYTVDVQDFIKDIVMVKPNKLIYKLNETKDLTGGQVQTIMASGTATSQVAMTDSQVVVTGYDTTSVGVKTITVQYKGFTKKFGITVEDNLSGIIIKTLPTKLDYKYGESLDLTGGTIEITKESGVKEIINMTPSMVSGYNSKKIGNQTLTVTYEGITQQFSVNVKDYISKIKVIPPTKTKYKYGEDIDLTEGKVSLVTASGKIEETVDLTASMISGFESKKEGTQTIKVSYKGLESSFNVNIKDTIKAISMASMPNKTSYKYGEDIDITGTTINVVKTSGVYTINVTKDMISGYSPNTPGNQSITVTYAGLKTNFIVYVEEKVISKYIKDTIPQKSTKTSIGNTKAENEPVIEQESTPQTEPEQMPEQPKNENPEDKPTVTLGVKDEKQDETKPDNIVGILIGVLGLLLILLALAFKHNVKVYEEEDGDFLLCGLDIISKKNLRLNIDKYLDNETKNNNIKIVLSKSITKRLEDKELEITYNKNIIKYIIKAKDKKEEIILKG